MHAHNHECHANSSASMSYAMHLPRVAVQLKSTKAASKTNRLTGRQSLRQRFRAEGCTTRFVTYGCESAQQLSVTVCLHKADIE